MTHTPPKRLRWRVRLVLDAPPDHVRQQFAERREWCKHNVPGGQFMGEFIYAEKAMALSHSTVVSLALPMLRPPIGFIFSFNDPTQAAFFKLRFN